MNYCGFKTRRMFSYEQMENMLHKWENKYPGKVTLKSLGKSSEYDIWCLVITEKDIDSKEKQNVVITAMHSGVEYSGANTVLAFGNWLLSGDSAANEILQKQVIVLIPCPNPFSYEKGSIENQHRTEFSGDPYSEPWTLEGVKDKAVNKEAYAVQRIIDLYKPELYIDCHGVFFENQIMIDSTGISVNGMGRAHNRYFVDSMIEEAERAGYAMDREDYRERILPVSDEAEAFGNHFQTCSKRINPAIYAYNKYHTLSFNIEISFEESGFLRLKKAVEMGNERWPLEFGEGYPVNRMHGEGLFSLNPCGKNSYEMRQSRVELWQNLKNYSNVGVFPIMPGKLMRIYVFYDEIKNKLNKTKVSKIYYSVQDLLDIDQIAGNMLEEYFGEDADKYFCSADLGNGKSCVFPTHGLCSRFYIPFSDAKIKKVVVNDTEFLERKCDGYSLIKEKNYTVVQVNIPPGKQYDVLAIGVYYEFSYKSRDLFDAGYQIPKENVPHVSQ